jgi:CRP/FNR family transcriptional regulator
MYLASPEGRQVTVRYARPGDVLGVETLGPVALFRISSRILTGEAKRDPRVSWAIARELNRRLYETLEQTAVTAFGSVRQRVAAHLLDLAADPQPSAGRLVARVSHQELAGQRGDPRRGPALRRNGGSCRPVTFVALRATDVTDSTAGRRQPDNHRRFGSGIAD